MLSRKINILFVLTLIVLFGCAKPGPAEIHYGQDQCDYCKMTIADRKFGSELVTAKGKIYKFDSIECLAAFTLVGNEEKVPAGSLWVTDFSNQSRFVSVEDASIVLSKQQNSPMGVGLLAFGLNSQAENLINETGGQMLSWPETCELVASVWKL